MADLAGVYFVDLALIYEKNLENVTRCHLRAPDIGTLSPYYTCTPRKSRGSLGESKYGLALAYCRRTGKRPRRSLDQGFRRAWRQHRPRRDNDWVLPDPERYLSGTHARVDFRAGSYIVVDTSSNGTYVNDATEPLGKFHEYTLQDGDFLRLGNYEFRVSIDATNDFPPDASGIVAYDGGPPSAAVRSTTANDLGADLDLSELLETGSPIEAPAPLPATGSAPARNVYSQSVVPEAPAPAESATPWHMMTRPVRISGDAGELDPGLAALCRGAGIEPQQLAPAARAAALQLAGQLLRESLLGLMELDQGRGELGNRLGVATASPEEAQPALNLSRGSVQDILTRLLSRPAMRAGSVDALRDKFRELKSQNAATLAAMQAALDELLARFSPAELEERFARSARRGVTQLPGSKERYWELYAELYATLSQRTAAGFPHLFAETFARDFDTRMSELAPPRRGSFGGE